MFFLKRGRIAWREDIPRITFLQHYSCSGQGNQGTREEHPGIMWGNCIFTIHS
jgi:hypothetical protein